MEFAKPKPGAIGSVTAVRGGNRGVNGQSAGSRGGKFVAQRCRRRKRCRLNEAQAVCRRAFSVRPSWERSLFGFEADCKSAQHPNDAAPRLLPSAPEAPMPDTRYYIVRHDRIWLIKFEDEEYGPYETQDEALRLASDAAEQLERHGENVEVHLVGL